jgi:hypothetical protein
MLAPFCDAAFAESSHNSSTVAGKLEQSEQERSEKTTKKKLEELRRGGKCHFHKGTVTKPKSEKSTERSNSIIILRILREDKKIVGI